MIQKNWKYDSFLQQWINLDAIFAIEIIPDKIIYINATLRNGNEYNLWCGGTKEEAEIWLAQFLR